MSHFSVLVIGENIAEQLAHYDENLEVAPYKKYFSNEDIEIMQKHYKTVSLHNLVPHIKDWSGCDGGIDEQGLFTWSQYNPLSKWDWYEIGGRWDKRLLLREKGKNDELLWVNSATKEMIDFEGMYTLKKQQAFQRWKAYQEALQTHQAHQEVLRYHLSFEEGDTQESYIRRQSQISTFALVVNREWHEKGLMGWFGMTRNNKSEQEW